MRLPCGLLGSARLRSGARRGVSFSESFILTFRRCCPQANPFGEVVLNYRAESHLGVRLLPRQKLYKVTTSTMRSFRTQWEVGTTRYASGLPGVGERGPFTEYVYAYPTALIAAMCHMLHVPWGVNGGYVLWEAEGDAVETDGLEVRCTRLTTVARVEWPNISTNARVRAAIYVARLLPCNLRFVQWSDDWLARKGRYSPALADLTVTQLEAARAQGQPEWHAVSAARSAAYASVIAIDEPVVKALPDDDARQILKRHSECLSASAFHAWTRNPVTEWQEAGPQWENAISAARREAPWGVDLRYAEGARNAGAAWARDMLDGFSLGKLIQRAIEDEEMTGEAAQQLASPVVA